MARFICPMLALLLSVFVTDAATHGEVTFLGPIPYRGLEDSPCYDSGNSPGFFVEDFEDGSASFPPGVFGYAGYVNGPLSTTDSVDADDGVIDGSGMEGHSFTPIIVHTGLTYPPTFQTVYGVRFDRNAMSDLPKCAGFVITDGMPTSWIVGLVIDGENSLSQWLVTDALFDDLNNGSTSDDWFFGVASPDGITSFGFAHTYQDYVYEPRYEVDHVQFSGQVPEPGMAGCLWFVLIVITMRCNLHSYSHQQLKTQTLGRGSARFGVTCSCVSWAAAECEKAEE